MKDPRDNYKATTLRILGNFQLIEFALKVYIGRAYKIIHHSVEGKIYFGYTASDVENYSLERLLTLFKKLNNNDLLIKKLNNLKDHRNKIAHSSLLIALGSNYDVDILKEKEEEFFYLEDEVLECLKELIIETKRIKIIAQNIHA